MLDLKKLSTVEKVWSVNCQLHFSVKGKSCYNKVRSIFDPIEKILGSGLVN